MSEWGNPLPVMWQVPGGKENKLMIPVVVASEPGTAQTNYKKWLESHAKESESLVFEINNSPHFILSTTRHVKSCGKQRGPPRKAKYSLVTDSELVP
ncbi:2293_t:CDS:2, partial [Ambispora leptoticha]